jgi:RNA polymerase sigma-70 factor, ECF subfamily
VSVSAPGRRSFNTNCRLPMRAGRLGPLDLSMCREGQVRLSPRNMRIDVKSCSDGDAEEDTELMLRACNDDSTAFGKLYRKYLPLATAYAAALGSHDASVGDIVQEAFMRLWDRRREYRGQAKVKTYIFAYVRNISLEERRHLVRQQALSRRLSQGPPHHAVVSVAPELVASVTEVNELVQEALAQLTDTQRQAVRLYHVEGMPLQQAAKSAGCTQKCFDTLQVRLGTLGYFLLPEAGPFCAKSFPFCASSLRFRLL